MAKVKDNKSVGVLDLACNTNAVATAARSNVIIVDLHEHHAVLHIPETGVLSTSLVHVVDIAVGRIILLAKVSLADSLGCERTIMYSIKCELVEKVGAAVIIYQSIASQSKGNQSAVEEKGSQAHNGQDSSRIRGTFNLRWLLESSEGTNTGRSREMVLAW